MGSPWFARGNGQNDKESRMELGMMGGRSRTNMDPEKGTLKDAFLYKLVVLRVHVSVHRGSESAEKLTTVLSPFG